MSTDENLKIWNYASETDKKYTEQKKEGDFEYTRISPTYQIRLATELWGPMGKDWGVKDEDFNHFNVGKTTQENIIDEGGVKKYSETILIMCNYTATLYYPDGEIPIHAAVDVSFSGSFGGYTNRHYSKSVATDALTKGLSKLGFNHDIYLQEYEGGFDGEENPAADKKTVASKKKKSEIRINFEKAIKNSAYDAAKKKRLLADKNISEDLQEKFLNGQVNF